MERNRKSILFGEFFKLFICFGTGLIITSVRFIKGVFNGVEKIDLFHSYKTEVTLILVGSMFMFYGTMFFITRNTRNDYKLRMQTFFSMLIILYGGFFIFVSGIINYNGKHHAFLIMGISLLIAGFIYVCLTIFTFFLQLIKENITDPKDRVTLMLGILGSVISAVALFK